VSATAPAAGGWSLRTRTFRAIAGVLALLLALLVAVAYLLWNVKHTGDELVDHWDPAYQVNQNLLNAMVNEETGVRGYALGQDDALLEPYDVYTLLESGAQSTLRNYLRDEPDLMRLYDATLDAITAWHTDYAEPIIAAVRAGDTTAGERAASAEARASFDEIRAASARLTQALDDQRGEVADERERAFTYLWVAGGVGTALLLLTGLALARGLRRGVLAPIDGLVAQTRQVAHGDLDLEIAQEGPAEIQGLAADVDSMRESLASQIARLERARERIAERSAELARSNADLEQFAYVASHDLSEPLRKVTNFCQLLERQYADLLDDKARTYISFMVDGAKRMQILINDLLDFSRVGRTTDQFRPVDLELKLERALSNLELELQESGAVVDHDPLPTVPGDATLLTALLQNLVGNAVKYRDPARPPHVQISVEQTADECTITVDDNGIGIDPQYAERIFQIFQRLHLRDQYGGTGIGLALCRKIVEFHRGRLWLAEKDGPGARFQFTLPTTQPISETADDDEPALPVAT
jgi:signal transduction histidine kinase